MTVYPEAVNDYMAINPLAFPMSEQPIVSRIKQIDWLNIVAQVPKRSSCKQLSIARPASPMQQRMDMGTPMQSVPMQHNFMNFLAQGMQAMLYDNKTEKKKKRTMQYIVS